MPILRCQVSFPRDTGFEEDVVVNTFHIDVASTLPVVTSYIVGRLQDFYNTNVPGGAKLSDILSPNLAPPGTVRIYNLSDPEPRVPIAISPIPLTLPALAPLADEIAIVLSVQGTATSGVPQRRRRGRLFIGPLNADAVENVAGVIRPDADTRGLLLNVANRFKDDLETANHLWVVYSEGARDNSNQAIPYDQRPLLPPIATVITNGWVDNALDTQRRRGIRSTLRDTMNF